MYIWYDNAEVTVSSIDQLEPFVSAILNAGKGAIVLTPESGTKPSLSVFVAGDFGYVFFSPDDDSAGQVATAMTPADCPATVHFTWGGRPSGDDIDADRDQVTTAREACGSLFEFLADGLRPKSITWSEL